MLSSEVLVLELSERTLVVTLHVNGIEFKLKTLATDMIGLGEHVKVQFDSTRLYLFDPTTGLALRQTATAAEVEADDGTAVQ
jgi:hypothetical protein